MSISSAGPLTGIPDPYGLAALQPVSPTAAVAPVSGITGTAGTAGSQAIGTDSVEISPSGQMLSKLQQLETKDPAQFKQVLSDIAGKLQTLAQQQEQSGSGQWLSGLANQFQTAANTGDLSALQPHSHRHHHHSHGASGGGQAAGDGAALQQALGNSAGASSPAAGLQSQLSSIFSEIDTALSK